MEEKRRSDRKKLVTTTVVRKNLPKNGYSIIEFQSSDASLGGIFIAAEDLSLFSLGEEIEILVDDKGKKYYEGKAKVVRSARVFSEEGGQVESGFGLMFLNPSSDFKKMLTERLKEATSI